MDRHVVSLNGVFPPIPTPFDEEGEVAYQFQMAILDYDLKE